MKIQTLLITMLLFGSVGAFSENEVDVLASPVPDSYDTILDSIEEAVEGRSTTGRIESIDLSKRTAIISGFMYHFGPQTDAQPLQVKLLGRNFGSLEMLASGMHVEVSYISSPVSGGRVGTDLVQIESSDQH